MSSNKTEYIIRIGPSDRYRHLHIKERGKIVFFRVQYEIKINDNWYPVVRYDTAHGFAHRDLLDFKGDVKKTPLFNQDLNDALTFAENDLRRDFWRKCMNKEKEMMERNIELSAEFSRYLFEHPELEEKIPIGAEIILLPEFDQELKEYNLELGKDIESEDGKVVYIAIKNMRPKLLSRIEKIELESVA